MKITLAFILANECFELETEHPPLTGWSRCEGEDGTALKTNTAKQCQEECAKKDGCQGFSWNSPALNHYNPENKLICCLKEVFNANDASHFGGIVSGPKKCGNINLDLVDNSLMMRIFQNIFKPTSLKNIRFFSFPGE